jgi:hypothetical protein
VLCCYSAFCLVPTCDSEIPENTVYAANPLDTFYMIQADLSSTNRVVHNVSKDRSGF